MDKQEIREFKEIDKCAFKLIEKALSESYLIVDRDGVFALTKIGQILRS